MTNTSDYSAVTGSAPVVLVEFYATWCPHCRKMMPAMEQVKARAGASVKVYQYDIDREQALADEAGVESIPTFLLYRGGRLVWQHAGEISVDALLTQIDAQAPR